MTNKEAIERIQSIKSKVSLYDDVLSLRMAEEALEKQKIGHWVKDEEMSIMFDIWTCSECGSGGDKHFKYCAHCGTKMEENKE